MLYVFHLLDVRSLAIEAMLLNIQKECKWGRMAIPELAELLGFYELSKLDTKDTTLFDIHVDVPSQILIFTFAAQVAVKEHMIEEHHSAKTIVIGWFLIWSCTLIVVIIYYKFIRNTSETRNDDFELNPGYDIPTEDDQL